MVKQISEQEFSQAEADNTAVVDFSAAWCGPCQMLAPLLEELSEDMEGKAAFYKVDTETAPNLTAKYSITSIPALVLMKNGVQKDMLVGFRPKEDIKTWVESHLD